MPDVLSCNFPSVFYGNEIQKLFVRLKPYTGSHPCILVNDLIHLPVRLAAADIHNLRPGILVDVVKGRVVYRNNRSHVVHMDA